MENKSQEYRELDGDEISVPAVDWKKLSAHRELSLMVS